MMKTPAEMLQIFTQNMMGFSLRIAEKKEVEKLYPAREQLFEEEQFMPKERFVQFVDRLEDGCPYYIVDHAGVTWCVMTICQDALLIGPIATWFFTRDEMNRYCRAIKGDNVDTGEYFRYITQVPLHNVEQIRSFISMCCQAYDVPVPTSERRICLGKADPLKSPAPVSDKYIDHYGDCLLALMVAVSCGDADKSKKLVRIICAFELTYLKDINKRAEMLHRLMAVSSVLHYGARRAGVPLAPVERLAKVCTERFLRLEEPFDILPLLEEFLNEVCVLVHSCSRHLYSDQISPIVDYIHTHFSEDISPGAIAKEFGINASYLATCFRRETGKTLRAYICQIRLKYASELLLLSNMPISDVCMKVGIPDQAYFTRLFKNEFGVSPSAYRQRVIGK